MQLDIRGLRVGRPLRLRNLSLRAKRACAGLGAASPARAAGAAAGAAAAPAAGAASDPSAGATASGSRGSNPLLHAQQTPSQVALPMSYPARLPALLPAPQALLPGPLGLLAGVLLGA